MSDSFAVHIGGGAYLDASGNLVFGPPTGAQIYQAPNGFKADTKKVQDAFKDLSDILPQDDEGKKKWQNWGVPAHLVEGLSKLAGVVGIVATAISVYLWVIGVMIAIMEIMAADDGMSPELGKALVNIKNQLQGLEQIQRADSMIQMHSEFDGRIDRMHGLVTRLLVEKPIEGARAQIFAQMRSLLDELAVPLSRLRDQPWTATYDSDAYKARGFAAQLLVFERSDGTLAPVPMISPNLTVFDYRLGVPMLLYGATAFAALAQVAMPWFRSAGIYAGQLRKTADAIDRFVIRMQDESIARTEYTAQTIFQENMWKILDVANPNSGPRTSIEQAHADYAVGAFDLVGYSDAFMYQKFAAAFPTGVDLGVRGLFNYDWFPPEGLWWDALAAAANEQSRQDYARLQVVTGMFRLISTAAWLRYLTTPPTVSQTVSGNTSDSRSLVDEAPTTAKSPSIFPVGVIEHDATLKRYNARARARLTVQEPGYVPAFHYRVVLRAINSLFGNEGWDGRGYIDNIWSTSYEPTQGDARCKRLSTEFRANSVLSEVVLFDGPSPTIPVSLNDTATFRATTFDWYVPVVSAGSKYVDAVQDVRSAAYVLKTKSAAVEAVESTVGTGGVSIHLRNTPAPTSGPMHIMGAPAPLGRSTLDVWNNDTVIGLYEVSLDNAERRHVRVEDVQIGWQLAWNADKLEVRLFGSPQQRPFQLYVVVEESVYSGETIPDNVAGIPSDAQFREQIHTPFAAEIVNQLVFVPEAFFNAEQDAIAAGSKMWNEFVHRFAKSQVIGPGDPIEFLQEANREALTRSPSTATLATTMDAQVKFAIREAPHLWNEALRVGGGKAHG